MTSAEDLDEPRGITAPCVLRQEEEVEASRLQVRMYVQKHARLFRTALILLVSMYRRVKHTPPAR